MIRPGVRSLVSSLLARCGIVSVSRRHHRGSRLSPVDLLAAQRLPADPRASCSLALRVHARAAPASPGCGLHVANVGRLGSRGRGENRRRARDRLPDRAGLGHAHRLGFSAHRLRASTAHPRGCGERAGAHRDRPGRGDGWRISTDRLTLVALGGCRARTSGAGLHRPCRAPSGAERDRNRGYRAAGACVPPETEGWSEAGRARAPGLPQTNQKFAGNDSRADAAPYRASTLHFGRSITAVALSHSHPLRVNPVGGPGLNPELAGTRPQPRRTASATLPALPRRLTNNCTSTCTQASQPLVGLLTDVQSRGSKRGAAVASTRKPRVSTP